MATITTRAGKGSALTHTEMDANFTNLNNDKLEAGSVTTSGLTMTTGKLLGRSTASTGAVEEITLGTGLSLSGGTLTASGGAAGTNLSYDAPTRVIASSTGNDATLPLFSTTGTDAGLVPGSSNAGATYFLTAAGTWAVPAGGGGGSGTVTSVAASSTGSITIGGSPITTSGTITVDLNTTHANSFTGQQTFKEIKETTFALASSGTIALDPANGSIQSSTLNGTATFTDDLEAGQTLVLHLDQGSSHTVIYPTITWVGTTSSSTPPTLTANDVLVFWKFGTTLYGAYVGSYV
jgi:hypothetical protein